VTATRPEPPVGRVPIALGSATSGTEEGRAFQQSRLALYGGWIFVISGAFYVAFLILTPFTGSPLDEVEPPTGDPRSYHLAATLVAGALWVGARRQSPIPARALGWMDAFCTVLICACFAVMAAGLAFAHIARSREPLPGILSGLLACSYVLISRAIALPSTPLRTLVVSTIAVAPLPVGALAAVSSVPDLPFVETLDAVLWSAAAVAMAVVSSRVIFGLRAEVNQVRQLGQYRLDSKIGEGGMGTVYRASHAMLRRPTAIKILPPEKAGEEAIQRFEREVQLTAQLSHPSTVVVFDYGRTPQGLFYYAMEYLEGLNLEQLVRADGPQPAGRVIHVLRQVAGALAEAHGVGLIHRDVKPANIILSQRGGVPDVAKVVDFGLVKPVDGTAGAAPDLGLTGAHMLVGTPLYVSPESVSGAPLDGRSDLYALGAVGYFLLTGTPVFYASSVMEVLSHHLRTPPDPMSTRTGGDVPAALEQVIMRCLAKRPEDRYPSARALELALERCAADVPWSADAALRWWQAFRDQAGHAVEVPPSGSETLTIDMTQRIAGD